MIEHSRECGAHCAQVRDLQRLDGDIQEERARALNEGEITTARCLGQCGFVDSSGGQTTGL